MSPLNDSIRELVRRARRRFLFNVAVSQAVLAASVGMAGAILILLFGAQFLDWRWLAALAIVTFPLAYYRTARRVPRPYRIAQIVDERLLLHDALSTAFYFSELAGPYRGVESMRRAQFTACERIGSQIDPKAAVPLRAPRTLYLFGSLFLAAAVLFGLRYGVQRRMDLDKPLARILIDAFGGETFTRRAAVKKSKQSIIDIWGQTAVDTLGGPESQYKGGEDPKGQEFLDAANDGVLQTVDVPEVDAGINQAGGDSKNKSDGKGNAETPGDESESSESAKGASNPQSNDKGGGGKQGESAAGKQPPNSSGEPSLASKIKDAMSSLMASMRTKPTGQNSQQSAGQSNGDSKQQQSKGGQKAPGQGQKSPGDPSAASEDGQPGEGDEGGKSADLKGSNTGSDGPSSSDKGSGAGQQDGDKNARIAEQLAAMGKISEIIGKRSANVTGEVTIEVTSSKQPLRTPYSDNKATHGEASGEISRDEVPAAFQEYVQQYFEQVRRPAKGPAKPAAAAPTTPRPATP